MGYNCQILLDSVGPNDARLTTFEITFPRIVLAEFNTHRVFSRNSASSRAIPIEKMLEKVRNDPFIPFYWGKKQKGMQAEGELEGEAKDAARRQWLRMIHQVTAGVETFDQIGLHKQLANRWLEPAMFHTVVCTATEWDNWEALRANPKAQPEILQIATTMKEMRRQHEPTRLHAGEWHMPLLPDRDRLVVEGFTTEDLIKISCARVARTSYLTHKGERDPLDDLRLYSDLAKAGHMSPFEHCARALTHEEWVAECREAVERWMTERIPPGNFWGWKQHRKLMPNEAVFRG